MEKGEEDSHSFCGGYGGNRGNDTEGVRADGLPEAAERRSSISRQVAREGFAILPL